MRLGPDVTGDDRVNWHAQKGGVYKGESQYAPDSQRLQNRQDQNSPFVEKVLQGAVVCQ